MNSMNRVLSLAAASLVGLCLVGLLPLERTHAQDVAAEPVVPAVAPPAPVSAPTTPLQLYVAHAPLSETPRGELLLSFAVTPIDLVEAVVVRWRSRVSGARVHEEVVARSAAGWVADIHDEEIAAPGIVYWVVRREPGTGDALSRERAVFASAAQPHPVVVRESEVEAYERRMLVQREGRRYRAGVSFEYVSLGQRDLPAGASGPRSASYWRSSANFSYAFFGIVDAIRFEIGILRGEREVVARDATLVADALGFNWGSGELLFRLHDLARIRTRLIFGVSQQGFELGGALALVIGDPDGTSLELGGEGVTGLGGNGHLRLGWATVPRVPMGATIELTTFPTADVAGVRLLFDAAYELYPGAFVRVTGGYRGWTSVAGGPSLAADLVLAF